MIIEELAAGILQVTNRGALVAEDWTGAEATITDYLSNNATAAAPAYLLFNIIGTTELDAGTFRSLLMAEFYENPYLGLAVLVGRRGQLTDARALLAGAGPPKLRLMDRLDNAIRFLLDKQVMDRIDGSQQYGR